TNIFFVKDDKVYTHPANNHILDGVTRKIVLKLCNDLDIPMVEKPVSLAEITTMDEAFFTGTTTQIASIAQLDDHIFYESEAIGHITKKLQEAFANLKTLDSSQVIV